MKRKILKDEVKIEGNKLSFSNRDFYAVLKVSGSKAKTLSGQRKAVERTIVQALNALIDKMEGK